MATAAGAAATAAPVATETRAAQQMGPWMGRHGRPICGPE